MRESLVVGRSSSLSNLIEGFNREGSGIEVDFSLPSNERGLFL